MTYNININYPMDYLFGGKVALASRIAANTAAATEEKAVFDTTRTTLNALLAAGLPFPTGRKKRLVLVKIKGCFLLKVSIGKLRQASNFGIITFSTLGSNGKRINFQSCKTKH